MRTILGMARRLGIYDGACYLIVTRDRWVAARRNGRHGHYAVTEDAIQQFARSRRVRLLVRPDAIPDPTLRQIATIAHLADPGRWWSIPQLAHHYGYSPTIIRRWRSAGWLSGQWQRYGKGYFWYGHTLPAPHVDPRLPLSPGTLKNLVQGTAIRSRSRSALP